MEIAVKTSLDEWSDYFIKQRNRAPSAEPEERLSLSGNMVLVWVPTNLSGVSSQTDDTAWQNLIRSYKESIGIIVECGGKSVCVYPLGEGELMWRRMQSALAARKAVEDLGSIPEDFRIIFMVSELDYEAWDDIMRF